MQTSQQARCLKALPRSTVARPISGRTRQVHLPAVHQTKAPCHASKHHLQSELLQNLTKHVSVLKEQQQANILQLAATWTAPDGHQAHAALSQLHAFYTEWAALYDVSEGLSGVCSSQEQRIQLLRLAGTLLLMESQMIDDEKLLALVVEAKRVLSDKHTPSSDGAPQVQRLLRTARWLEHRLRVQGYHPVDATSYSAVLSRADRKQQLDKLRKEEKTLLAQAGRLLFSLDSSPEVDVSAEELAADEVLAEVARAQGWAGDDSPWVIRLHLSACISLLRHHPDASLRRQVYEVGLEEKGLEVLDVWSQLSHVRHTIARLYGQDNYTSLAHSATLLGSSSAALDFLARLHLKLRPAADTLTRSLAVGRQQGSSAVTVAAPVQHDGEDGQQQQQQPDVDSVLEPWNLEHCQMQGTAVSTSKAAFGWQLHHLVAGVSELLQELMGVSLVLLGQGVDPSSTAPGIHSEVDETEGGVALHDLVHAYLQQIVADGGIPSDAQQHQQTQDGEQVLGYAVWHENRGCVGTLIIHSHLGKGARYLLRQGWHNGSSNLQAAGQPSGSAQAAQGLNRAHGVSAGPVVLVGLQPTAELDPVLGLAWTMKELLHELGHALQQVLSWQPHSSHPPPCTSHVATSSFLAAPTQLPLELVELPSHLLELLVSSPTAMQRVCHAAGRAAGHASDEVLSSQVANAARQAWYNPITLDQQVLSYVLDQQLCEIGDWMNSRRATGVRSAQDGSKAAQGWSRLCAGWQAAHLPRQMWFSGFLLQGLQRTLELQGQGYAYLVAWSLAAAAWEKHGLLKDPCDARAWRQVRTAVYEQDVEGISSDVYTWVEHVCGDGPTLELAASQEVGTDTRRYQAPVPDQLLSFCYSLQK